MSKESTVSRRRLLGAGLGASSVVLLGRSVVQAAANGDDLRCGMIGTGGRGRGVLHAIHKSPNVRVTALCDINPQNLGEAAKMVEADKPQLFEDYRTLLDFKEMDAVFVHTPCDLHAPMFLDVLKTGRHLYAEKPLGMSVAEVNAVAEAAKASSKVVQSGTQLRYASPWQPAVMAAREGKVGKIIAIRAQRQNSGDLSHSILWVHLVKRSGDIIVEQAVHELDLFNWIFDGMPEQAAGFGGQSLLFAPPGRDTMDHYGITFDYGDKRTVSYSHSWLAAPGIPHDGFQILAYGADGAVDVAYGNIYMKPDGKHSTVDPNPAGDSTQLAVDDFFRCIRENKKPLADVDSGRACVLTALLGRKAIYEKRVVTMKELLAKG